MTEIDRHTRFASVESMQYISEVGFLSVGDLGTEFVYAGWRVRCEDETRDEPMAQHDGGWAMNLRSIMIVAFLALTAEGAAAKDLAAMGREEVTALQRRLADAGCYTGAIDGTSSQAVEAAVKFCPVMDPILSIDTGMHTAPITRIAADPGTVFADAGVFIDLDMHAQERWVHYHKTGDGDAG